MPDRDKAGKFLPGNKIAKGKGRPVVAREEKYLERFKKAVTLAEFEAVSHKWVELAMAGNVNAIRLLMSYAIGNPTQKVEATVDQRILSANVVQIITEVYGDDQEVS